MLCPKPFQYLLISLQLLWLILINATIASENLNPNILCNLPTLGHSGYLSEDGLIFYWNLCPENGIKVNELNPKCSNESAGDVCVLKVIYLLCSQLNSPTIKL